MSLTMDVGVEGLEEVQPGGPLPWEKEDMVVLSEVVALGLVGGLTMSTLMVKTSFLDGGACIINLVMSPDDLEARSESGFRRGGIMGKIRSWMELNSVMD